MASCFNEGYSFLPSAAFFSIMAPSSRLFEGSVLLLKACILLAQPLAQLPSRCASRGIYEVIRATFAMDTYRFHLGVLPFIRAEKMTASVLSAFDPVGNCGNEAECAIAFEHRLLNRPNA